MDDPCFGETAQKLLQSFMRFGKTEWHHRLVAGYKPSEVRLLLCIKKGTGSSSSEMKVSEISRLLHVTSPTITQLLKGLEADGLVERRIDPTDRRAVYLRLTDRGEEVAQKAMKDFAITLRGLIDHLGEDESLQLVNLLDRVFVYFNEKEATMHQTYWNGEGEA